MRHQHEKTTLRYLATSLRAAVCDGLIPAVAITALVEQLLHANMGMRFSAGDGDALKTRQAGYLGELGLAINEAFTSDLPASYFALETQLERDRFLHQAVRWSSVAAIPPAVRR